ncbi:hypothetical protein M514_08489 [Trichuris suis]|uniref:DUF4219 domain-containing protein n=1 Tax=Trichuris suis TaxID=68888 RepID=A0A085N2V5_9BILA|nr:hypothetical protein M514_08489 [Trichuris suis]
MQEVVRKLEEEIASIQTQLAVKRCNVITSSVGGLPESKHLDGTSYSDWKFAMKNYLMDSGLWQCFMRSDVNEELSQRALAKINLSIKPCAWAEVGKAKTAKETREGLRYAYQDKGIVRRIGLYSSLFKTRFENCHSTTNYSNRIASTAEQLEAVGKPLDDETVGGIILGGLPAEFQPLILRTQGSNQKIFVAFVKSLLQTNVKDFAAASGTYTSCAYVFED